MTMPGSTVRASRRPARPTGGACPWTEPSPCGGWGWPMLAVKKENSCWFLKRLVMRQESPVLAAMIQEWSGWGGGGGGDEADHQGVVAYFHGRVRDADEMRGDVLQQRGLVRAGRHQRGGLGEAVNASPGEAGGQVVLVAGQDVHREVVGRARARARWWTTGRRRRTPGAGSRLTEENEVAVRPTGTPSGLGRRGTTPAACWARAVRNSSRSSGEGLRAESLGKPFVKSKWSSSVAPSLAARLP